MEVDVPKGPEGIKCTESQKDPAKGENAVPPSDVKTVPSSDVDEVLIIHNSEASQKRPDAKKSPNKAYDTQSTMLLMCLSDSPLKVRSEASVVHTKQRVS